jgi:exodeoxyribonuclease V alpha subunit
MGKLGRKSELRRNLVYTGITRGKKLGVLIGLTLGMVMKNNRTEQRFSGLRERLKSAS